MGDEDDVNRRYFVWYVEQVAAPGARVLDFGCGGGTVVRMLRRKGFDAYGVDIGSPGADFGDLEASELGRQGFLRYYDEGAPLPFADDMFDVVISDQVFEHVEPLEAAVGEIERVTRPGGVTYHHFPYRTVWREGHIGIPFSHRLPAGRARLLYTMALRSLGAGKFRDGLPTRQWAEESLAWVDRWTVYRGAGEIEAAFGGRERIRHREIDYCRFRAADRPLLRRLLARPRLRAPAEALFRRLAFEALEIRMA
ncbi:MAG TPA: class I SAM-dependent methyltransferase [Solirubrobacter sp.]|nr:class I SAM-dependent methyltransferase [Solirubrobacter sp.]